MERFVVIFLIIVIISTSPVYAHKLISHDGSHQSFDTALLIPDHKISWAIYDNLGANEAKFYSFDAIQGDSFYASIVVPKISGLENYSPTMILKYDGMFENNDKLNQMNTKKILYEGEFPGKEFYEPFGQITYWERQEIRTEIPFDGKYFIVVMDEKNQNGKYSLAIGTIEAFSGGDLFTLLPKAWIESKLFVNDYSSVTLLFLILITLAVIPLWIIIQRKKLKKSSIVNLH